MTIIKEPERFQKISAGIQSIVITLAVVIGGIWTLYVFNSQLQVENAHAQLQKLKRELNSQPNIEVLVQTETIQIPETEIRYITGDFKFRNSGTRNTVIKLSAKPIMLSKVSIDIKGDINLNKLYEVSSYSAHDLRIRELTVYPNMESLLPFIVRVDKPGLYFISVVSNKSDIEKEVAVQAGGDPSLMDDIWGASKFIYVN